MLTLRKISLLLLSSLLLFASPFAKANTNSQKADYIYNFIQYVDWNETQDNNQVVIGVIGNTEVYSYLEQKTSSNELSKSVKVRSFENIDLLLSSSSALCHILFVSDSQNISSANLEKLAGKSILLVGEKSGFIQQGGLINFVETKSGTIKFEINQSNMINYGFKVSPQLLRIALLPTSVGAADGLNGSNP